MTTETTTYGNQLPSATELWELLSDILVGDRFQEVTGDEETTEAITRTRETLSMKHSGLLIEVDQMVRDRIETEGWTMYSQETIEEILGGLDFDEEDATVLATPGAVFDNQRRYAHNSAVPAPHPDAGAVFDARATGERLADADLPDSQLLTDWRAAGERLASDTPTLSPELAELEKLVELDVELTEEQLSLIMSTFTWSMRDVLGRWLGGACDRAGIVSKRQRHALQYQLMRLFGEA